VQKHVGDAHHVGIRSDALDDLRQGQAMAVELDRALLERVIALDVAARRVDHVDVVTRRFGHRRDVGKAERRQRIVEAERAHVHHRRGLDERYASHQTFAFFGCPRLQPTPDADLLWPRSQVNPGLFAAVDKIRRRRLATRAIAQTVPK
jgi:hypothetical protein